MFTGNMHIIVTIVANSNPNHVSIGNNLVDLKPLLDDNFHILNGTNIVVRDTINLNTYTRFLKNLTRVLKNLGLGVKYNFFFSGYPILKLLVTLILKLQLPDVYIIMVTFLLKTLINWIVRLM